MAKLVRAISENGGMVLSILDSTDIVNEMEQIHHPSAVVSAALGRLLTGSLLMAATLKNEKDSITVRVKGGGPVGSLLTVADGKGNVKGYAENPLVELPARADGKLDVGGAVGNDGLLTVIRDSGVKEPYIGQIPLISGEIAEDITSYYATSEQIPTVCALGVLVERDLTIKRAGGYLLQLLPGATEKEITQLEQNVSKLSSMTEMLENGHTVYEIIDMVLEGFDPNVLDETEVQYHCDCSRDRVERAYMSLGQEELQKIAVEQETVELKCQFCNRAYQFKTADYVKRN
ncbi:MAG: molecular chaperone Hsp33 [Clostridiales bacterium]|jgi:molecular chaperone Hsp33|nr:molecular chaperone Hsp33 [Clostridiales bacterium]